MEGASPVSREVQKRLCEIFPSAQIGQAYGNVEIDIHYVMFAYCQRSRSYGNDNDAGNGVSYTETGAFRK